MELEGKVIAVLDPREGVSKAGNAWKVQEYVIETKEQYSKKMCFEVFGADKIQNMSSVLQIGNDVKVSFDIDAREWNGKYFNSIRAWKVELVDQSAPVSAIPDPQAFPAEEAFPPAQPGAESSEGSQDDLPF